MTIKNNIISSYLRLNNVEHIIQTQPTKFQGVNTKRVRQSDAYISSNPYYCKMSKAENSILPRQLHNTKLGKAFALVIPELESKPYEQAFIFDLSGKLIAKSITKLRYGFNFSMKDSRNIINLGQQNVKMGMIHKHINEVTFSYQDLTEFQRGNFKITMAKTPNGFAYLERDKTLDKSYLTALEKKYTDIDAVGLKLAKGNKSPVENIHLYNEMQNKKYKEFAQQMGINYEFKPGGQVLKEKAQDVPNIKDIYKNFSEVLFQNGYSKSRIKNFYEMVNNIPLETLMQK